MKLRQQIESVFPIKENHEPYVVLMGGTNSEEFSPVMARMLPEEMMEKMDENTSSKGLRLHPVMAVIMGDTSGRVHVEMVLPLQGWSGNMVVEESIIESNDIKRITDYVAGFIDVFCMNGSVTGYDIATEKQVVGKDSKYDLLDIIKQLGPKRTIPGLESIGSVEEIMGQMSKKEIEAVSKKPKLPISRAQKVIETIERAPISSIEKDKHMLKTQSAIAKKYGYPALVELVKKMNQPLLVKEPRA